VQTEPFWLAQSRPPSLRATSIASTLPSSARASPAARARPRSPREGKRVRVYDARGVGEGASGRNGGFALRGAAARYDVARETYGADGARDLWRRTEAALDRLEQTAGSAFRRTGSLRLAADVEERVEIEAEYEALREDGFAAEWHDEVPHLRPDFRGAIFHPTDGAVQPAAFVQRLADRAVEAGVAFVEHHRVEALDALEAEQIVIATDGSGRGLLPELDDALWPARGQVIATEPLPERLFDCPHYARHGFDYWQQLEDGAHRPRRLPRLLDPDGDDR
jgi:glycine/D-amino acid oxidase-like deaminating enzyme